METRNRKWVHPSSFFTSPNLEGLVSDLSQQKSQAQWIKTKWSGSEFMVTFLRLKEAFMGFPHFRRWISSTSICLQDRQTFIHGVVNNPNTTWNVVITLYSSRTTKTKTETNSDVYDMIMAFDKALFIRGVGRLKKNFFLSDHCVKILQVIFISLSWARLKSKTPCV